MDFDFDSYGNDEEDEERGDDAEIEEGPDPGGEETETVNSLFQKSLRQVNREIEKENNYKIGENNG